MIEAQECDKCKTVPLAPENYRAVDVIEHADPIMWQAGGAVAPQGIETAFRICRVAPDEEPEIYAKLLVWIQVVRDEIKSK